MSTLTLDAAREKLADFTADFDFISFLAQLSLGAYIVDNERRIIYWNQAAQEITGYCQQEVVGKRCMDNILAHKDRCGLEICNSDLCPLLRTIKTGISTSIPYAVYSKTKENKRIPVNVTSIPLVAKNGEKGGLEIFGRATVTGEDMATAMKIQRALIPGDYPAHLNVFYHPASMIGGDILFINENWIVLADVSGHGISAALVATGIRAAFSETLLDGLQIHDLTALLEKQFALFATEDMFYTGIFLKKIHPNHYSVISFGHPAPILAGPAKTGALTLEKFFPIGFGLPNKLSEGEITLNKGESLLLYSDGLVELPVPKGLLGLDGLLEIVSNTSQLKEIYENAVARSNIPEQPDDISMIRVGFEE